MTTNNIGSLITANPNICHGKPVIKGTRIMVWQILELLESGEKEKQIYQAFPSLPKGAVKATLHYAAERAKGTSYRIFNANGQTNAFTPISA